MQYHSHTYNHLWYGTYDSFDTQSRLKKKNIHLYDNGIIPYWVIHLSWIITSSSKGNIYALRIFLGLNKYAIVSLVKE